MVKRSAAMFSLGMAALRLTMAPERQAAPAMRILAYPGLSPWKQTACHCLRPVVPDVSRRSKKPEIRRACCNRAVALSISVSCEGERPSKASGGAIRERLKILGRTVLTSCIPTLESARLVNGVYGWGAFTGRRGKAGAGRRRQTSLRRGVLVAGRQFATGR